MICYYNTRRSSRKEKRLKESFNIVLNERNLEDLADLSFINEEESSKAQKFHASFPQYSVTPLKRLNNLADLFGK